MTSLELREEVIELFHSYEDAVVEQTPYVCKDCAPITKKHKKRANNSLDIISYTSFFGVLNFHEVDCVQYLYASFYQLFAFVDVLGSLAELNSA